MCSKVIWQKAESPIAASHVQQSYDNLYPPRGMVAKTKKNIEIHTIQYEKK